MKSTLLGLESKRGVCSARRCDIPEEQIKSDLALYLKAVNEIPLLTADEEKALARKIKKGDQASRERMIKSNLRLVVSIAKSYNNRGLSFMDLVEEGNLGLLKAVEKFDPAHGCRFSTYATWWIKQAIRRALVNTVKTVRIPSYMVELVAKAMQVQNELLQQLGRFPTVMEVADAMKLPEESLGMVKRVLRLGNQQQTVSLEAVSSGDNIQDFEAPRPEEGLFNDYEIEKLQTLLNCLDQRESKILRMRYGLIDGNAHTLKEISEEIGITRERVRQIENQALKKLFGILTRDDSTDIIRGIRQVDKMKAEISRKVQEKNAASGQSAQTEPLDTSKPKRKKKQVSE